MTTQQKRHLRYRFHLIHGFITVVTGGLWLPIWVGHYLFHHKVNPIKAFKKENQELPNHKKVKWGLVKFAAICLFCFSATTWIAIETFAENKKWQETRGLLITQIEEANLNEDYNKSLELIKPHKDKLQNDSELSTLVSDTRKLQREKIQAFNAQKWAERQAKAEAERVAAIDLSHKKIDNTEGVTRDELLLKLDKSEPLNQKYYNQIEEAYKRTLAEKLSNLEDLEKERLLLSLDKKNPSHGEYLQAIQEVEKEHQERKRLKEEFLTLKRGEDFSYDWKFRLAGSETNMELSNSKRFVAYNEKYDVSYAISKTDEPMTILRVNREKQAFELIKKDDEERKKKIQASFSMWNGSHRGVVALVKDAMHDADSYKHIETTYSDKGDHLIINCRYSGTNGYGGRVQGRIIAKVDLEGNVLEVIESP